jgi:hypothetical protein
LVIVEVNDSGLLVDMDILDGTELAIECSCRCRRKVWAHVDIMYATKQWVRDILDIGAYDKELSTRDHTTDFV